MSKKLDTVKKQNELLRTTLANKIIEQKLRNIDDFKNSYESIKWTPGRKAANIDTKERPDDAELTAQERIQAIAEARSLYQNDLNVSGFVNTLITYVIGESTNVIFRGNIEQKLKDKWGQWKRDCYLRGKMNFNDVLKVILKSVLVDGDCLVVMDSQITKSKIVLFESDQLVEINEGEWKTNAITKGYYEVIGGEKVALKQIQGVIVNSIGEPLYYCVTNKHGLTSVKWDESTIFKADICSLVKPIGRPNSYRGVSQILPMVDLINDLRALIKYEVLSAKRQAQEAIIIQSANPFDNILSETGMNPDDIINGVGGVEVPKFAPTKHEELEDGGGIVSYIGKDEEVKLLTNNRPNPEIEKFSKFVVETCAKKLGLYSTFATGKVDGSYSSARSEILLTFQAFAQWQKILERYVIDFCMVQIAGTTNFTVQFPEPISIDPEKEIGAKITAIKMGLSTYKDELGELWENKIIELGVEKQAILDNKLDNLDFFSNVGGQNTEITKKTKNIKE